MSYIHFDKSQMVNLSYSLNKELLRTSREGGYSSTTIVGCNTGRYHGLLVAPQPAIDGDLHVLLSSLEESVIQHDEEFQLAVHVYKGDVIYPKGHKYIQNVDADPIPSITYQVGGVKLKKERINTYNGVRTMVKYTLLEAHSDTLLKIRPLLAYRNRHALTHCNDNVTTDYENIRNGIRCRMYVGYSYLNFQLNKQFEYLHAPDWYYNFEYLKDRREGHDYIEDLFSPGFFTIPIKVGESVILSVATDECNPKTLTRMYNAEVARRIPRDSFKGCLINSAQQFLVRESGKYRVIAGYQWLGVIPRDTFISLPALTLTQNHADIFRNVVNNMINDMNGPFFNYYDNIHSPQTPSVDASLWFVWAVGKYAEMTKHNKQTIWKQWGNIIGFILQSYKDGCDNGIHANGNGLLHHGKTGLCLTWMNSIVNNQPVTPRNGYAVEINALWYNAIKVAIDLAGTAHDTEFVNKWDNFTKKLEHSFLEHFWDEQKGYLCDYMDDNMNKDWKIRPNMLIAAGMPHSPLTDIMMTKIVEIVESELLTPRGIRSLSPRHEEYVADCEGDFNQRGLSMFQGPAYPFLLQFYADTLNKLFGMEQCHNKLRDIVSQMEEDITNNGIGSISQLYCSTPPFEGRGTISHATSTAAVLWIIYLLEKFDELNTTQP